jgi:hypothetical protein
MHDSVFQAGRWPQQLVGNFLDSTNPPVSACNSAIHKVDLVFSIEVAEHLPISKHGQLADLLVSHVGGFLVFSAARPRQAGIGHVALRHKREWREEFSRRGLVYLERTTLKAMAIARNGELKINLLVFAAASAPLAFDDPAVVAWEARGNDWQLHGSFPRTSLRRPSSFARSSWAHLVAADECLHPVQHNVEHGNRDKCNATHSAITRNHARKDHGLRVGGERVSWLPKVRLWRGEAALWPELVYRQAGDCWDRNASRIETPPAKVWLRNAEDNSDAHTVIEQL